MNIIFCKDQKRIAIATEIKAIRLATATDELTGREVVCGVAFVGKHGAVMYCSEDRAIRCVDGILDVIANRESGKIERPISFGIDKNYRLEWV